MNPTRKRRLALVGVLLAAAAGAAAFIVLALQENLSYLHTPDGSAHRQGAGERALPASAAWSAKAACSAAKARSTCASRSPTACARCRCSHHGILPDMFKEGTSIVATGRMRDGVFVAEKVLAKHDETYMPKEVADAMAKGAAMHTKSCGAN
jgi:cytochrome c-type biogenesis protein CcmE